MAALIRLAPDVDWTASGGLFDFTLEYLIDRVEDKDAAAWMREVVDNNLGSLWITEFPQTTQRQILDALRSGLVSAAERDLPESDRKAEALDHLRALVDLSERASGEADPPR
jgi:hypothetical protein